VTFSNNSSHSSSPSSSNNSSHNEQAAAPTAAPHPAATEAPTTAVPHPASSSSHSSSPSSSNRSSHHYGRLNLKISIEERSKPRNAFRKRFVAYVQARHSRLSMIGRLKEAPWPRYGKATGSSKHDPSTFPVHGNA
jgi:hypothetical protein